MAASKMASSDPALPLELMHQIMNEVDQSTLVAFARVNRTLSPYALDLLYKDIHFVDSEAQLKESCCSKSEPELWERLKLDRGTQVRTKYDMEEENDLAGIDQLQELVRNRPELFKKTQTLRFYAQLEPTAYPWRNIKSLARRLMRARPDLKAVQYSLRPRVTMTATDPNDHLHPLQVIEFGRQLEFSAIPRPLGSKHFLLTCMNVRARDLAPLTAGSLSPLKTLSTLWAPHGTYHNIIIDFREELMPLTLATSQFGPRRFAPPRDYVARYGGRVLLTGNIAAIDKMAQVLTVPDTVTSLGLRLFGPNADQPPAVVSIDAVRALLQRVPKPHIVQNLHLSCLNVHSTAKLITDEVPLGDLHMLGFVNVTCLSVPMGFLFGPHPYGVIGCYTIHIARTVVSRLPWGLRHLIIQTTFDVMAPAQQRNEGALDEVTKLHGDLGPINWFLQHLPNLKRSGSLTNLKFVTVWVPGPFPVYEGAVQPFWAWSFLKEHIQFELCGGFDPPGFADELDLEM